MGIAQLLYYIIIYEKLFFSQKMRIRTFLISNRSFYQGLIFGIFFESVLFSQSLPNTNLEQFVCLIDSVWKNCLSDMNIEQDQSIAVKGFGMDNPVHALVRRRLEEQLNHNHIQLWMGPDSILNHKYFIVDILNAGIHYSEGGRKKILGRRWIWRHTDCHISVQLRAYSEELIESKSYKKHCTDRIYVNNLSHIEQKGAILGYPVRPGDSDVFSRLEPWFMIGSVGMVIYLFYIIRS